MREDIGGKLQFAENMSDLSLTLGKGKGIIYINAVHLNSWWSFKGQEVLKLHWLNVLKCENPESDLCLFQLKNHTRPRKQVCVLRAGEEQRSCSECCVKRCHGMHLKGKVLAFFWSRAFRLWIKNIFPAVPTHLCSHENLKIDFCHIKTPQIQSAEAKVFDVQLLLKVFTPFGFVHILFRCDQKLQWVLFWFYATEQP